LDELAPLVPDPRADPEVAFLAGTLSWLGFLVAAAGTDLALLASAASFFLPVFVVEPAKVPKPLTELLQAIRQQPDQFLPFCAHWCSLNPQHKGLMLLQDIAPRLNDTARGRAESLGRLSGLLWAQTGNPISLSSAIAAAEVALGELPPADLARADLEHLLGCQLQDRAAASNSAQDLDSAIEHMRAAVAVAGDDPAGSARYRSDLCGALQDRYRETSVPQDLADALVAGQQSVAAASGNAIIVHNYAGALLLKFRGSGDPADAAEGIQRERDAVRMTARGEPGRAVMLASLAGALRSSYQYTHSDKDLNEAIDQAREALDEVSPADVATRGLCLGTLGVALLTRFQKYEQVADLADAVQFSGQAAELAPPGGTRRALWLSNYGGALRARYGWTQDRADMIKAIGLMREAAAAVPVNHPDRARYAINVSAATQHLCRAEMSIAALDEAGAGLKEVLDNVADGPAPMLAALLSARGALLTTRYEQTNSDSDLQEALRCCREAVRLSSRDGRNADYAANLASTLLARARRTNEPAHQTEALAALLDSAADPGTSIRARIFALRVSATMIGAAGNPATAAALLAEAVRLLALTVPRQLARADQEHWLGQFSNLAADAAASAIAAGQYRDAVTILEQGRGILIGQSLELRSGAAELSAAAPELADRFEQIRSELDASVGPIPELNPDPMSDALATFDASRSAAARRSELVAELDRLTGQIRELPGMAGFLRRPHFEDIASAAASGPVIFLNVSELRSDALVLRPSGVEAINLNAVTPANVAQHVTMLGDAVRAFESAKASVQERGTAAAQEAIKQAELAAGAVLDWLWRAVVAPVLAPVSYAPGSQRTPGEWASSARAAGQQAAGPAAGQLPRVWWLPVGLLSFLPIHAAVSRAGGTGALDLVVSSYAPTVAALTQARKNQRPLAAHEDMLVITMPVTPGAAELPGAAEEAELLTKRFRVGQVLGSWSRATGQATRESVTDALPRHAFAHFACHASCDSKDPAASVLRLQDHQATPLTMADILALSLECGQLAYLSACETAITTPELANEGLHLMTAFGLAGYPQVIGTLWRIDDSAGYLMTDSIYRSMSQPAEPGEPSGTAARSGPGELAEPQPQLAASALHAATLKLRQQFPADPILWAAHIHSGA
jgi:tetratricopeptide (TPR) repeat protein